jgi:hypothetical protein
MPEGLNLQQHWCRNFETFISILALSEIELRIVGEKIVT